ncbi:polar amino acid transport system substrate-binding protein [Bradyrhizobium sp. CIR18]|uniref:ectoine/hydroxyectoine ABC transporter substrate-binding protein EhuB n=1 Tax=Bradyrhizobium sp. CIR18 TaxID=2663839 RepID=UPI001606A201|nr:ectoine/hydroxyectoine ABC transporter substrate-binding protein EhuB [Bradyrhizobium sp. CIR18]MBB4365283.1 polar amino acid transport system substrate-binding protein [Bradyrhizobium sp. CIR18]
MHFVDLKVALLGMLLAVVGCSFLSFAKAEDPVLASMRKAGEVKVALASNPPYQFVSPTGEAKGAGIDLQSMVLKRMDLPPLTPSFTQWDAMIPGLQAHQFDFVGAGLSITESRCKAVLFSTPFYAAQTGLYLPPGNPKHLRSVAEVAYRPEIKLSAIATSAQLTYAQKQGVKPEQIMIVPDIQAGAASVIASRADAFIVGEFSIPNPRQKGLELVVDHQSPVDGSGAAFRKEDVHFRDAFNKELSALIRSGTIQKLYEKYGIGDGDREAELLAKFTKASDIVPDCE